MRSLVTRFPGRPFVAALPLIFLLNGCRSASSYLAKGNELFAKGEFAEASLNYRKALQKEPNSGEAYYRLGVADLKLNKAAEALQDLQQAVRWMPGNTDAKTELTNLALGAYVGDPQRPRFLYDVLVKWSGEWTRQDPHSLQGLRIKGYLAMLEQRPDEAVDLLQLAHQYHPQDEKIVDGLMDALFRNKQTAEAEKIGLDFIATDHTASDVYDALYRLYAFKQQPADAENIFVRKVKDNPKEGAYILQLAGHYVRVQKKTEMANAMQMFLANPGGDPRVHLHAGDFYAAIADWPSALAQYNSGLPGQTKDKSLYQDRIARALLAQNKRPEALQVLNDVVAHNPDDKEAAALRASLLLGKETPGKTSQGIQELQALVKKNPDDAFLKFVFAKAQLESGDLAGADAQLAELTRRNPRFLEAQLLLADIAFKQGNLAQAIQGAENALELDPSNFRGQLIRGTALLRLGNLDAASSALNSLSRQAPDSEDVRLELARLQLRRRNFADAEAAFNKMRESNPKDLRAIAGLADVDIAQNRPKKALARLDQELTRSHGSPEVLYLMAVTALRTGKYGEGVSDLQRLVALTPDSIDPQLQLAAVFQLGGDYRNAIATLEKAALLQPKDPRPQAMLPSLLEMDYRLQEAKTAARRALSLSPDDPALMNNLAYLVAQTGDNPSEALKLVRQALNKRPQEPYFLDTLGFVYLKRDQNDDALDVLVKLVQRYPAEPIFAYHAAIGWFQKGDHVRAKALLTRALRLGPPKEVETGINDLLIRIN